MLIGAIAASACSASAPPDKAPAARPDATLHIAAPCSSGAPGPGCAGDATPAPVANAPCTNGTPGPRCDGLLSDRELRELGPAIDAAQKAVKDSAFRDVHAIALLARLQIRRDAEVADTDGSNDAARGLRNGMRAVAVDDASAEARLVLAVALARSLQGGRAAADPEVRPLALDLVSVAVGSVPAASGAVGAAAKTMEGYVALERGQKQKARSAFSAATLLFPKLATAWVGLGDAARSDGDFDAAAAAYKTAASLLPEDVGIQRSLDAAKNRVPLALGPAVQGAPTLAPGPLAPAAPPPPACSPAQSSAAAGASLCKGLAAIARATTRDDLSQGAQLVIAGWNEMQPLCDARDPACGPHVAQALAAASRAFHSAGQVAKSIAAAKLVLGRSDLPGASALAPDLYLEIGDRYFAIGVFDQAAGFYARHVESGGAAAAVVDRVLAIQAALGDADSAARLAAKLSGNTKYSDDQRARWLLAAATATRAVRGPEAASTWLRPYEPLLQAAGVSGALSPPKSAPAAPGAPAPCASPLACAVRRLAGEAW